MASCSDSMEFYVTGSSHLVRVSSELYNALARSSAEPILSYLDEDGERIMVGSATELRDRIAELKEAGKFARFDLSNTAGPEWFDPDHPDTLIVKAPIAVYDLAETSTPVPAGLEIVRPASVLSEDSFVDVPTPEGRISEVASTAGDSSNEDDFTPAAPGMGDRFSKSLTTAFENMLTDTRATSHEPLQFDGRSYGHGNSQDDMYTDTETVSVSTDTATEDMGSSTSTARPSQTQNAASETPNWADMLSDNVRRAVQQLQELAKRNAGSSTSPSHMLDMDPSLPDSVAELVRKIVNQVGANVVATDRNISNASAFTRSTFERTKDTFQDFAAQIGHVALIGGYQAAAASREAAEIGLQATREAIRAAKENTQIATNQLQSCLREIAAQFNESQTGDRRRWEAANNELSSQINEMWNSSRAARSENSMSDACETPSNIGSSIDEYFGQSDAGSSFDERGARLDERDTAMAQAGAPPLPRKIPIEGQRRPQFGPVPDEFGRLPRAASFPEYHYLHRPPPPPHMHSFPQHPYAPPHPHMRPGMPPSPPEFDGMTSNPMPFSGRGPAPPHILDLPIDSHGPHGHRSRRRSDGGSGGRFSYPGREGHGAHFPHHSHPPVSESYHPHGHGVRDDSPVPPAPCFYYYGGPPPPPRPAGFPVRSGGRDRGPVGYVVPSMDALNDRGLNDSHAPVETDAAPVAQESLNSEGTEWDQVASELHRDAPPLASIGDAVRQLRIEDEQLQTERAHIIDAMRIENTTHAAPVLIDDDDVDDPWGVRNEESYSRAARVEIPSELYRASPGSHSRSHVEIEDVSRGQDPLAGSLSRGTSYTDGPGMPPSPQRILQEGLRQQAYTSSAYVPSISGQAGVSSYQSSAPREGRSQFMGQDRATVESRIQAARRRHGDGAHRTAPRPQTYIEMRQLGPEAQNGADINRLGLENEASDAERQCARHLVELELITPDNMALAIYYAQQAKGDISTAIDLLEEDMKQSETYERRNRPVENTANPLVDE